MTIKVIKKATVLPLTTILNNNNASITKVKKQIYKKVFKKKQICHHI